MENLNWKLYIVVYEEDVTLTTTISISVSVGAVVLITCLSLAFGLYLSHVITKPISFLRQQFELIKYMDLDNIHLKSSVFSEINLIFSNLDTTVHWLREIKSFVPENVFLQLQHLDAYHEEEESPQQHSTPIQASDKKDEKLPSQGGSEDNLSNSNREIATRTSASSASELTQSRKSGDVLRGGGVFKMGLTNKECSVLYITLPDYLLLYSHEEISNSFPKIISALSSVSKIFHGNLQIVSNSEFKIVIESKRNAQKPVTYVAQECALKIVKGLEIANALMAQQYTPSFSYYIGVATSSSFVGNLGTSSVRFFSCISQACENAKNLSFLASQLKVHILIDERTQNECRKSFITRPVDRILFEKSVYSSKTVPSISTVYHLIKESFVESDEWLYELQAKNENENCNNLHSVFDLFKPNLSQLEYEDALTSATVKLECYLSKNPNDVVSQKLLAVLGQLTRVEMAQSYHSKVTSHSIIVSGLEY
ncbi:hypothetical protein FDP41_013308 [Naegleria fowleri]|uniref:Guanylate cyclase domain-containing protein n=1 Tax=Naegleria fowleri TaxID=5763 RepID=A0A6A5C5R9_NAEFO|nr:uncharacterized protein FDP41_013308 [Naegleria fowleri]KAF0980825.1 hypothetical protein FDP41_013308 [Naegleria fowleri]